MFPTLSGYLVFSAFIGLSIFKAQALTAYLPTDRKNAPTGFFQRGHLFVQLALCFL